MLGLYVIVLSDVQNHSRSGTHRQMVFIRLFDDAVAVVPRDHGVGADVDRAAQSHRVAFRDVTISQFRRELECRSLGCFQSSALDERCERLPFAFRRMHGLGRHPVQRLQSRQHPVICAVYRRRTSLRLQPIHFVVLRLHYFSYRVLGRHLGLLR